MRTQFHKALMGLLILLLVFPNSLSAQLTNWTSTNGGQDYSSPVNGRGQGHQGPCYIFAVLGAMEALYQINYNRPNDNIDLSEKHLYSPCVTSPGVNSTAAILNWVKDNGVMPESCFPYRPCVSTTIMPGGVAECYNDLYANSSTFCDEPECFEYEPGIGYIPSGFAPANLYKIDNWLELSKWSINTASKLETALRTYGPLVIEFDAHHIHPGATNHHAVTLLGRVGKNKWRIKDSWPNGTSTSAVISDKTVNFPSILQAASSKTFALQRVRRYSVSSNYSLTLDPPTYLCNDLDKDGYVTAAQSPVHQLRLGGICKNQDPDDMDPNNPGTPCTDPTPSTPTITSGPSPINLGQFVTYTCASVPFADGYTWSTTTPNIVYLYSSGNTSTIVEGFNVGVGNVRVQAYNCNGTSGTASVGISVTSGGGGGWFREENLVTTLQVYPNPADDLLNLEINNAVAGPLSFQLIDMVGKTHFRWSEEIPAGNFAQKIPLHNFSPGIYIVSIDLPDGNRYQERVVIQ